jgi:hypothetical protein
MKRKKISGKGFFKQEPMDVPAFGTGEVAEILEVPIWRLQKFLDSPSYQLSPEGRLGRGRGWRRMFSIEDIYRIAIAARMVSDGFAAPFVGSILAGLENYDFHHRYDEEGDETTDLFFGLHRTPKGTAEVKPYITFPVLGQKDSPYYVYDIAKTTAEIDGRIAELRRKRPEIARERSDLGRE